MRNGEGGLAVSLALTAVGGQLGADVDLSGLGVDAATQLFSESNSRFIVTAAPEKAADLEVLFAGMAITRVGTVTAEQKLVVNGSINVELGALVKPFKETLHGV